MGKSLENSVFIATFVGDSTKNLYSKNQYCVKLIFNRL